MNEDVWILYNMGIFPASHVSFNSGVKSWQVPAIGHNNLLNLRNEFKETYIHPQKKRGQILCHGKVRAFLWPFLWGL